MPVKDFLRAIPGKNEKEELFYFRAPSVRLPQSWSFCRFRRHINAEIGNRRDPAWSALSEDLANDIERNPGHGDIFARLQRIIGDPNSLKNIRLR
jgi:hypothetical protein